MGSSTVMMCSGLVRLMMSTSDAKVVDFPEPVGPVTRTRPWRISVKDRMDSGMPEHVEGRDLVGDDAQRGGHGSPLLEDVEPESPHVDDGVGGVELLLGLETLPQGLGEDPEDHVPDHLVGEDRAALDGPDGPVEPDARRQTRR